MYVATSFIGSSITPGEVIPSDIPAEKLEWLKKAGAVREIAPVSDNSINTELESNDAQDTGAASEPIEPEAGTDQIDEEEEAPEIDVMDGVVAAQDEPEQKKPARVATRKPSGKATKGGKAK